MIYFEHPVLGGRQIVIRGFKLDGCIGCPFAKDIKSELETLSIFEPSEYKRAQWLWKTVYDEYRRIGYRLDNQPTLFD